MNFSNTQKLNLIAALSLFVKILVVFFFFEDGLKDEWKILLENFEKNHSFSYYNFGDLYVPSSYMPPLYLFFIIFCKFLSFDLFNYIYIIYFFQILVSTFSIFIFFNFCKKFISNFSICLIGVIIFSFFPLLVYGTALISSATLQVFFYLAFFNFFLNLIDGKKENNLIISLVASACLLLRGEFIIIFLFSLFYLIVVSKKYLQKSFLIFLITLTIISPYLVRNYLISEKIHIVSVTGYALWKGNNHLSKVEGYWNSLHPNHRNNWPDNENFKNLINKLDKIKKNENYEAERDKIFLLEGIKNIQEDKMRYFCLYLKKLLSFYFIDINSSYKNYYNIFNIVPIMALSFFSIPGFFIFFNEKKNDYKFYYITSTLLIFLLIISIFSILPRYKISILGIQILFSLFFLKKYFNNFFR